jgi:hypothetical protein
MTGLNSYRTKWEEDRQKGIVMAEHSLNGTKQTKTTKCNAPKPLLKEASSGGEKLLDLIMSLIFHLPPQSVSLVIFLL